MEPIRRLKAVGGHDAAEKCQRPGCGKILVDAERETRPYCRRCHYLVKMEQAVDGLRDAQNK